MLPCRFSAGLAASRLLLLSQPGVTEGREIPVLLRDDAELLSRYQRVVVDRERGVTHRRAGDQGNANSPMPSRPGSMGFSVASIGC